MRVMVVRLLFVITSLLFFHPLLGTHKTDSLYQALIKFNTNSTEFSKTLKGQIQSIERDTIRIKLLNELAWEYKNINSDTAILFSSEALFLSINHSKDDFSHEVNPAKIENEIFKAIANSYLQLGVFNAMKGNYPEALNFYNNTLRVWEQLSKDSLLNPQLLVYEKKSRIYGNIGNVYYEQGNFTKALEIYLKSLSLAELTKSKTQISARLNTIGNVYLVHGDYLKALEYYHNAYNVAILGHDTSNEAVALSSIGIGYRHLKNYDSAIVYHLKSMALNSNMNRKSELARDYVNLAAVYYDQGYLEKSIELDFKALELCNTVNYKRGTAVILGNIGSSLAELGRYKESETYLKNALKMSAQLNSLELMRDQENYIYELYEKSNQPVKALEHFKKYVSLKDSIFNKENNEKLIRSEMNFEFEKKEALTKVEQEKLAVISRAEKRKQQFILISVSAFLLVVIVFSFFLYKRWRLTQQQKAIIEKQQEKILDSIGYAKMIQQNILVEESEIQKFLPGCFVFFQPKDIVSGDFYWFADVSKIDTNTNLSLKNKFIIATVDCTGHGVPGAFMSMIGNTLLNQIVREKQITTPSEILYHLNIGVNGAFSANNSKPKTADGMDIGICYVDYENKQLQYAGAHHPLYLMNKDGLRVIKADRISIGVKQNIKKQNPYETQFTNHIFALESNMNIYLTSDGFQDQFAYGSKEKFGTTRFKELIESLINLSAEEQKTIIASKLNTWKGQQIQIDDILVVGLNIQQ